MRLHSVRRRASALGADDLVTIDSKLCTTAGMSSSTAASSSDCVVSTTVFFSELSRLMNREQATIEADAIAKNDAEKLSVPKSEPSQAWRRDVQLVGVIFSFVGRDAALAGDLSSNRRGMGGSTTSHVTEGSTAAGRDAAELHGSERQF
ncbi:hypothetical protein DVH05_008057 [Phytophthora capsici]|nr:hypothetical protein DVH05_008057 [Phytophthora capsici]